MPSPDWNLRTGEKSGSGAEPRTIHGPASVCFADPPAMVDPVRVGHVSERNAVRSFRANVR
ncbi:hypothetical protein ColTof4_14234 [Colletotrichum tofieldiae]|nr:hypothetical protein ColTof3_00080 [Colletotrichum tofieldiae]GKT81811.1 hypothetical protein ColTof4_14234 [Colletotrichum tofieldiae]